MLRLNIRGPSGLLTTTPTLGCRLTLLNSKMTHALHIFCHPCLNHESHCHENKAEVFGCLFLEKQQTRLSHPVAWDNLLFLLCITPGWLACLNTACPLRFIIFRRFNGGIYLDGENIRDRSATGWHWLSASGLWKRRAPLCLEMWGGSTGSKG